MSCEWIGFEDDDPWSSSILILDGFIIRVYLLWTISGRVKQLLPLYE